MSVDDNFCEAVRKSAEEIIPGDKTEYRLKVRPDEGILAGVKYDYAQNVISPNTVETLTFKSGGASGTTVAVLVVTYTDSTRADISTVERTT